MNDIIVDTTPLNLLAEKAKFFEDPTYNPQFEYTRALTELELHVWGEPQEKFYQHAVKLLAEYPHTPLEHPEYVSQEDIQAAVTHFNREYHLDDPIGVEFSDRFVTRCRIAKKTIYFQLPLRYTKDKFQDLYRHEFESHMLRRLNHRLQPWGQTFTIFEPDFRRTEEGIAGLHTHLLRKDKVFRKSYLTYIAVYTAQRASFTKVFHTLREYHVSESTAWNIAVRTKRGLTDTSQPGGLTKDISYFEGAVQVWDWLMKPENNPRDLYLGRLSLVQIPEYKSQSTTETLRYPVFMQNPDEYLKLIAEIGHLNHFQELV